MRKIIAGVLLVALLVPGTSANFDYYEFQEVVDYDTAADIILPLGSSSAIMPLELSTTDSTKLTNIQNYLTYGGTSAANWLSIINAKLSYSNDSIATILHRVENYTDYTQKALTYGTTSAASLLNAIDNRLSNINNGFGYGTNNGTLKAAMTDLRNTIFGNNNVPSSSWNLNSTMSNGLSAVVNQLKARGESESVYSGDYYNAIGVPSTVDNLSQASLFANLSNYLMYNLAAPSGEAFLGSDGLPSAAVKGTTLSGWLRSSLLGLASQQRFSGSLLDPSMITSSVSDYNIVSLIARFYNGFNSQFSIKSGLQYLNSSGSVVSVSNGQPFSNWVRGGIMGLSYNLNGSDKQTAFSFLSEDIQSSSTVQVDNILDALGSMGTNLQNPLQRLAFVFANPQDLEIRENVSEETDAVDDNFFKSGSAGKVDKNNIGDAASFVSTSRDMLKSDASASDAFQVASSSYGFWTQQTADDLDNVGLPVPLSDDVDNDWWTDYSLDDDGYYQFYDPDAFTRFFLERR